MPMSRDQKPRRPPHHPDVDEVVRRYRAGASLKTVGRELGSPATPSAWRSSRPGFPADPPSLLHGPVPDTDDVRRRYESGESVYAIARNLGSTEHLVRKAIERPGMERRLASA
jgi:hypothetical protein